MEGLKSLLEKLSIEDVEKLKILMSLIPAVEQKEVVTLRVFAEEYKILIKNNSSAAYYRSVSVALNYLDKYFKTQKAINSISLKEVESFLIYLQQNVKKGYVVYYRNLKAAFNKAKDWGYVKENYFTKIKLPKRQKTAPAFINSSQLSAISSQMENDAVRDVVVFAFYTGMRLNEIVNLRWKNINLNNRVITVGDEYFETKGRKQRFIPISEEAYTVLVSIIALAQPLPKGEKKDAKQNVIPIGNNYVFCKSNGEKFTGDYFTKRFKSACKKAGIDKLIHFHSLRHSFASNLVQKGVSLYKIKELLGHSSITTTEIYTHLNLDSLREAISKLDNPHQEPSQNLSQRERLLKGKPRTSGLKLIINK